MAKVSFGLELGDLLGQKQEKNPGLKSKDLFS